MTKVGMVVASDLTLKAFLLDQIAALRRRYDVTVVAGTDEPGLLKARGIDVEITPVRIERQISLRRDVVALLRLCRLFHGGHYALVHSVTPKAGLLTMSAAFLTGVPVRVHMFTGQVWATQRGLRRFILKTADRVTAAAATHVLADSHSQRAFLVAEGIVDGTRIEVLGPGSICGVDTARFRPDPAARRETRAALGVPQTAFVFVFVGRLKRDKGVMDLCRAFTQVASSHPDAYLVLAGPDEENLTPSISDVVAVVADRVKIIGFTRTPERLMAAGDVFCLPSYREGFGSVVLEAAAAGLPSLASRIYGLTDAVVEGETGIGP